MDTTALDPILGQLVDDRYEVTARIARGGMATVYRATDRRLDRTVAVKVMHPHLAESPDFVARFRREARAAARLSHPGVVAVHDQGTTAGAAYLTMEFVDGPNLRAVLRERGALPVGEALGLVEHVLDALASAHRAGLVHRDIKPENVLLTPDGRPKLADFGLARAVSEATAATTGTVLGTVAYLAPEIVTEGRADARADVYAVGVLLYELLTGAQPFVGEAPIQIAFQHVNSTVPAPSSAVPWLPVDVDDVVGALTARDPDERPKDADAALPLVRRCLAALDPVTLARRADVAPTTVVADDDTAVHPAASGDPDATRATELPGHGTVALPIGAITRAAADPPAKRRRGRRLLAVLLVLLVAAGGLAAWWFLAGPGARVPAPTAVGLTEAEAVAAVEDVGLVPVVEQAHHDTVPEGVVVSSHPEAGTAVPRDGEVTLTVSLGILMIEVPPVVDLTTEAATTALLAVRLEPGTVTEEYHGTVPAGTILSSTPAAGELVEHTRAVDLVVSKGREPVELPDVVGRPREEAVTAVEQAGLAVSAVTEEFSDDVPVGEIISQEPAAGSVQLYRDDAVRLVASRGPELFEVPNVFGQRIAKARKVLKDAGFVVEVKEIFGGPLGLVQAQDPRAGFMLPRKSVITLTVV
ncbi:MAG: Stk1 family PASTA domain-containing Ser/Thr kinase [Georgenia sp.]